MSATIPSEWVRLEMGWTEEQCPPDLTSLSSETGMCPSKGKGFWCTRRLGHAGRHAAGTAEYIAAAWR